uniref:BHLH domain-containing protein n=1 Tax=Steinernema glaseri TaxID=37863 RepID=A0A1I7XX96_9BILA
MPLVGSTPSAGEIYACCFPTATTEQAEFRRELIDHTPQSANEPKCREKRFLLAEELLRAFGCDRRVSERSRRLRGLTAIVLSVSPARPNPNLLPPGVRPFVAAAVMEEDAMDKTRLIKLPPAGNAPTTNCPSDVEAHSGALGKSGPELILKSAKIR